MTIFLFVGFLTFLDQASKWLVVRKIPDGKNMRFGKHFQLTHVRNTGAALGLLSDKRVILTVIPAVVAGILIYNLTQETSLTPDAFSYAILLSGSLGNLIDRLFRKKGVVDFVALYKLPIFNFADFFLFIGVLLLIYDIII